MDVEFVWSSLILGSVRWGIIDGQSKHNFSSRREARQYQAEFGRETVEVSNYPHREPNGFQLSLPSAPNSKSIYEVCPRKIYNRLGRLIHDETT